MLSETFYLVRSKQNGQYLVARPHRAEANSAASNTPEKADPGFLLMFKEYADALSYLNTHGKDVVDQFGVESLAGTQIGTMLKRWGFSGVGIVQDPLLPRVEFLQHDPNRF